MIFSLICKNNCRSLGTQPPPVEEIMFPPGNIRPPIVPAREEGDRQRQRPDPPPQEASTATTETTSETVETTLTVGSTEVSSSDQTTAATTTTTTSVTTALTVEDVVDLKIVKQILMTNLNLERFQQ